MKRQTPKQLIQTASSHHSQIIRFQLFKHVRSQQYLQNIYQFTTDNISPTKNNLRKGIIKNSKAAILEKTIIVKYQNVEEFLAHISFSERYFRTFNKQQSTQFINFYITQQSYEKILRQNDFSNNSQFQFKILRQFFQGQHFHKIFYLDRIKNINNQIIEHLQEKNNTLLQNHQKYYLLSKSILNALHCDFSSAVYIPSFDNIYFDGAKININCISFETLMFLKKNKSHLNVQNFKHIYYLLNSNVEVFTNWQKMEEYLKEKIKVRSFFCMLFSFITLHSPIQMIWEQKIAQSQIEWENILNAKQIKNQSLSIRLIKEIPNRWKQLLNKQEIKNSFKQLSEKVEKMINTVQNLEFFHNQKRALSQTKIQKSYFFDLFNRVFVLEQQFGWKELFNQPFLHILRFFYINQSKKNQLNERNSQFYEKYNQKLELLKVSFAYLHKYFVKKQIKQIIKLKKLKQSSHKQKIAEHIKHFKFETFLALKLGLSLEQTLDYNEWFQVFLSQNNQNRSNIDEASINLYKLIETESGQILKQVKGVKLYHLKRIQYVISQKLSKKYKNLKIKQCLDMEVQQFILKNRPYEHSLKLLIQKIRYIQNQQQPKTMNKENKLQVKNKQKISSKEIKIKYSSQQIEKLLKYTFNKYQYPDINLLMFAYFAIRSENQCKEQQKQGEKQKIYLELKDKQKMPKESNEKNKNELKSSQHQEQKDKQYQKQKQKSHIRFKITQIRKLQQNLKDIQIQLYGKNEGFLQSLQNISGAVKPKHYLTEYNEQ